jgi:hypothetical protein
MLLPYDEIVVRGLMEEVIGELVVCSDVDVSEAEVLLKILSYIVLIFLCPIAVQAEFYRLYRGRESVQLSEMEQMPNMLKHRKV